MDTNIDHVTLLIDQINFLKEENNTKNTIIPVLSENQSHLSKQSEKQELIFPKNVSLEKIESNTEDLTKNASNLQPPFLNIDLQEQSCARKDTTSLRENRATPNNDKKT